MKTPEQKARDAESKRAWLANNPDYIKRWRATPEQKAKQAERLKKWRADNPDYAKKRRELLPTKPRTAEQRAKQAAATKRWRDNNAETYRTRQKEARMRKPHRARLRVHRLSEEAFFRMLELQGYKCAACPAPVSDRGRGSHIDHDHSTGVVRGVLCQGCNVALGNVKDNPETLERLAAYLRTDRN